MGFFSQFEIIDPKVQPIDSIYARNLFLVVAEQGRLTRRVNIGSWAKEFSNLRENDKIPQVRIETVLEWYLDHFDEQWVPQAYSASGFRLKFISIEQAMKRWQRDHPTLTVNPTTELLVKRLRNFYWPRGSIDLLPMAVSCSYDYLHDFLNAIRNHQKVTTDQAMQYFIRKIRIGYIGTIDSFLYAYFQSVYDRVSNWEEWSGDLRRFILDTRTLDPYGRSWSTDCSGSTQLWNNLKEVIGEN